MYLVFVFADYYANGGWKDYLMTVNQLEDIADYINSTTHKHYDYIKGFKEYTNIYVTGSKASADDNLQVVDINTKEIVFDENLDLLYEKEPNHWLFSKADRKEVCTVDFSKYGKTAIPGKYPNSRMPYFDSTKYV